nr:Gag-Pol polyprotein [Tanacetum cinerariifolium]
MSASNQQTLTDSGANDRPPMLVKRNYIPWEIRLMYGFEVTNHVRHSRLMDEFDKFVAKEGELHEDSQEDKLTTAMMLLAREITQKFSIPTNNRLRTSSNTKNQAVIQDGRVDIQTKNAGYDGNRNHVLRTESNPGKANVLCYNCNEKGHYARDCQKPRVSDAKYFREQMLLAIKDEARSNLNAEENDFNLNNSFEDETLEEITAVKELLQKELETCKEWVKTFESKTIQCSKYKETGEELEREIRADKATIERILKEKDKIESDFFKIKNEKIIIQQETQLGKKDFKERENRYLDDIVDLEEKLTGLGYQNPIHLKKAIAAQPKMYHDEMLYNTKLKINSPDSKETLENAEESRLKMRKKMAELEKSSSDSNDIQANLLKRIKILENDFKRSLAQNLLMTISELKNKIKTIEKGKELNTEFDKSETSGTLLCVTALPKNIAVKAKNVSNTKVNTDRKSLVQYFHVFGYLCYPINDRDDIGKMKPKADIDIFIGYSESSIEYYAPSTSKVSNNSAANTLDDEDTPSPSSIIVEDGDAFESWFKKVIGGFSCNDSLRGDCGLDILAMLEGFGKGLLGGRHWRRQVECDDYVEDEG